MVIHKTAAKHLLLHESIYNNDAYMYFQAKKEGFLPRYIKTHHINYRSPSSLSDHIKQSSRFQNSAIELQRFFTDNLSSEYSIPKTLLIPLLIKNFLINPIYFFGYIGIFLRAKFAKPQNLKRAWNIAVSTKGA